MAALLCCGDVIRRPQLSLYHCVPFLVEMNKEWKVLAVFFSFFTQGQGLEM